MAKEYVLYIISLYEVLDQVKLIYCERDNQNSGSLSGRQQKWLGRGRRKFSGENILIFDRVMTSFKTTLTITQHLHIIHNTICIISQLKIKATKYDLALISFASHFKEITVNSSACVSKK